MSTQGSITKEMCVFSEQDQQLIAAVRAGDYQQCEALLPMEPNGNPHANVNAQDDQGWTPLHHLVATSGQHLVTAYRIYRLLRQHGASLEVLNQENQKPLQVPGFNSRALPLVDACPLALPGVNVEQCFAVPLSVIEDYNKPGLDSSQLPLDWWNHWLTEQLDREQQQSAHYSRQIRGARVHVLEELPTTLEQRSALKGDVIYVPAAKTLAWLDITVDANLNVISTDGEALHQFQTAFAPYWQAMLARCGEAKLVDECPVPLVMALTPDDLMKVIADTVACPLPPKHFSPDPIMLADLQKLYAYSMGLPMVRSLSEDECTKLRNSIVEGIGGCSGGVGNRIGQTLAELLGIHNFEELLYATRASLLKQLVKDDPMAGGVRDDLPETHARNTFFTVASVQVGVLPENCRDPHGGGPGLEQVLSAMWSSFRGHFRLYPLVRAVVKQFQSCLRGQNIADVPYSGRRAEGYSFDEFQCKLRQLLSAGIQQELDSYQESIMKDCTKAAALKVVVSSQSVQQFGELFLAAEMQAEFDRGEFLNLFFEMDPSTGAVLDIDWNRLKLWLPLLLQNEHYFTSQFTLVPGTAPTPEHPYALWVSEPQDVIDYLADSALPFQVYHDFLQAYTRHAPETVDGAFLNALFLKAVEQQQTRICTYLLSEYLGTARVDLNQQVQHQPLVAREALQPALNFYQQLRFDTLKEPPRFAKTPEELERERAEKERLRNVPKPYHIPYVNAQWFAELTPLMMVIKIGDLALAKQLVAQGASVRSVNSRGCTVLHVLAYFSQCHTPAVNAALLAQLLSWGVDPLASSDKGYWPSDFATHKDFRAQLLQQELTAAIQRHDPEAIKLAIHKGAAVNPPAPQAPAENSALKQQAEAAAQQSRMQARAREERLAQLAEQRAEVRETVNAWIELQYLAQGGDVILESAMPVASLETLLHSPPRVLHAELMKRFLLEGKALERFVALRLQVKTGTSFKDASIEALENFSAEEQQLWTELNIRSFSDLHACYERGEPKLGDAGAFAALFARLATLEHELIKAVKVDRAQLQQDFAKVKKSYACAIHQQVQQELNTREGALDATSASMVDPVRELERKVRAAQQEVVVAKNALTVAQQEVRQQSAQVVELNQQHQQLQTKVSEKAQEIAHKSRELAVLLATRQHEEKSAETAYQSAKAALAQGAVEVQRTAAQSQALDTEITRLRQEIARLDSEVTRLRGEQQVIENEITRLNTNKEREMQKQAEQQAQKARLEESVVWVKKVQAAILQPTVLQDADKVQRLRSVIGSLASLTCAEWTAIWEAKIQPILNIAALVEIPDGLGDTIRTSIQEILPVEAAQLGEHYDLASKTLTISGYNVSWQETWARVNRFVDNLLAANGLQRGTDDSIHVVGDGQGLVIQHLAEPLQELIREWLYTHRKADKGTHVSLGGRAWKELHWRDQAAKELLEDCGLTVSQLLSRCLESVEIVAGHHIVIESHYQKIALPGVDLVLKAGGDVLLPAQLQIDTSMPQAPAFVGDRVQALNGAAYRRVSEKSNGSSGEDGASGLAGRSAGDISIEANHGVITHLDTLSCNASGGNGATGQKGGDGDAGYEGVTVGSADPIHPDTISEYDFSSFGAGVESVVGTVGKTVSWLFGAGFNEEKTTIGVGRQPGLNANGSENKTEQSGDGGNGGRRGAGGAAGHAGVIALSDSQMAWDSESQQGAPGQGLGTRLAERFKTIAGVVGQTCKEMARGGESGPAGFIGASTFHGLELKGWWLGKHLEEHLRRGHYDPDHLRREIARLCKTFWHTGKTLGSFTPHNNTMSSEHAVVGYYEELPGKQCTAVRGSHEYSRGQDHSHELNEQVAEQTAQGKTNHKSHAARQQSHREQLAKQVQQASVLSQTTKLATQVEAGIKSCNEALATIAATVQALDSQLSEQASALQQKQQQVATTVAEQSTTAQRHQSKQTERAAVMQVYRQQLDNSSAQAQALEQTTATLNQAMQARIQTGAELDSYGWMRDQWQAQAARAEQISTALQSEAAAQLQAAQASAAQLQSAVSAAESHLQAVQSDLDQKLAEQQRLQADKARLQQAQHAARKTAEKVTESVQMVMDPGTASAPSAPKSKAALVMLEGKVESKEGTEDRRTALASIKARLNSDPALLRRFEVALANAGQPPAGEPPYAVARVHAYQEMLCQFLLDRLAEQGLPTAEQAQFLAFYAERLPAIVDDTVEVNGAMMVLRTALQVEAASTLGEQVLNLSWSLLMILKNSEDPTAEGKCQSDQARLQAAINALAPHIAVAAVPTHPLSEVIAQLRAVWQSSVNTVAMPTIAQRVNANQWREALAACKKLILPTLALWNEKPDSCDNTLQQLQVWNAAFKQEGLSTGISADQALSLWNVLAWDTQPMTSEERVLGQWLAAQIDPFSLDTDTRSLKQAKAYWQRLAQLKGCDEAAAQQLWLNQSMNQKEQVLAKLEPTWLAAEGRAALSTMMQARQQWLMLQAFGDQDTALKRLKAFYQALEPLVQGEPPAQATQVLHTLQAQWLQEVQTQLQTLFANVAEVKSEEPRAALLDCIERLPGLTEEAPRQQALMALYYCVQFGPVTDRKTLIMAAQSLQQALVSELPETTRPHYQDLLALITAQRQVLETERVIACLNELQTAVAHQQKRFSEIPTLLQAYAVVEKDDEPEAKRKGRRALWRHWLLKLMANGQSCESLTTVDVLRNAFNQLGLEQARTQKWFALESDQNDWWVKEAGKLQALLEQTAPMVAEAEFGKQWLSLLNSLSSSLARGDWPQCAEALLQASERFVLSFAFADPELQWELSQQQKTLWSAILHFRALHSNDSAEEPWRTSILNAERLAEWLEISAYERHSYHGITTLITHSRALSERQQHESCLLELRRDLPQQLAERLPALLQETDASERLDALTQTLAVEAFMANPQQVKDQCQTLVADWPKAADQKKPIAATELQPSILALSLEAQTLYWQQRIQPLFNKANERLHAEVPVVTEAWPHWREAWNTVFENPSYQDSEAGYHSLLRQLEGAEGTSELQDGLHAILALKGALLSSYSVAVNEGHENLWLLMMDRLLAGHAAGLAVTAMTAILKHWHQVVDPMPLLQGLASAETSTWENRVLALVFMQQLQALQPIAVDTELLLVTELTDSALHTIHGGQLLQTLLNRLQALNDDEEGIERGLAEKVLKQLRYLKAIGAHESEMFIHSLQTLPWIHWDQALRRYEISSKLGLQPGEALVDEILAVATLAPKQAEAWWRLLTEPTPMDRASVAELQGLMTQRQVILDESLISTLKQDPTRANWQKTFADLKEAHAARMNVDQDLSLSELIQAMLQEGNESPELRRFLTKAEGQCECEFERIIRLAREKQSELYGAKDAPIVQTEINAHIKACQDSAHFLPAEDEAALIQWLATLLQGIKAQTDKDIRDTQLLALLCFIKGLSNGQGCLGNIFTGEGKSLITQLFALTCAMKGRRVDVLTSSPSLAERDAKEAQAVLRYFGINVSNNCDPEAAKNPTERKVRYEAHIVYGDIGSFQRDRLLTDSMGQGICPEHAGYVVIDEADSLLIDGADRVLYLSHQMDDLLHLRPLFELIWSAVLGKGMEHASELNVHTIKEAMRKAVDDGVIALPQSEAIRKLVDRKLDLWIRNAFVAKSMPRDRSYSVMDKGDGQTEVVINDLPTGVEQLNAQWSNGLHIFLQLRYSQPLSQESLRAIYVSNVSYLQEYARAGVLFGMSGTLGQEAEQAVYRDCFKMDTFRIPRFKPDRYQQIAATPIVGSQEAWLEQLKSATKQRILLEPPTAEAVAELQAKHAEALQKEQALRVQYEQQKKQYEEFQEQQGTLQKRRGDALMHLVRAFADVQGRKQAKALVDGLEGECTAKDEALAKQHTTLEAAKKAYREAKGERETLDVQLSGRRGQPVLIICKDKLDVKAVAEELHKQYAERLSTNPPSVRLKVYDSYVDDFELETEGLEPGDIIVATNIAGRGTDLPLNRTLVEKAQKNPLGHNGQGLHVMLGYMPSNVRTEQQAFYRAARKGEPGSGQFVVWDERAAQAGVSISIGQLQAERDALEQKRLNVVMAQQIPAKELGERLSQDYKVFEAEICAELQRQGLDGYRFEAQKAALRSHWALWEDEFSPAIEATHKTGDAEIWAQFAQWKNQIRESLNASSERLVILPMQLFHLGKQHYDAENYAEAIRCFDQAIAQEPVFSEFSYYYRGAAKLANDRSVEAKRAAKKDFKEAIRKFKQRIEERQTANQINQFNRERLSQAGDGLVIDRLIRRNNDEIALMTQHMQACYRVVGSELTPALFKREGVDEEAAQAIFDHLRQTMRDQIKDYRISRKVTVEGEIRYQGRPIRLPEKLSDQQRAEVVKIVRQTRAQGNAHEQRVLAPNAFESLFAESKEDDRKKQSQQLWEFLEAQGVVKQPKMYRPELTTAKDRIEQISDNLKKAVEQQMEAVRAKIPELQRTMSEREWNILGLQIRCSQRQPVLAASSTTPLLSAEQKKQWYAEEARHKQVAQVQTAIQTALDQVVGNLHTLPQVALEGRKIEEFFAGQDLPQWITQYMQGACQDVLNLVEAKDDPGFNWDAFCCALIGVAQIVAGTLLSVCCPAAAALGEALISEGIGDISFAVKGMINGDFSWQAYGEHKVQSLVLSFATLGVGVALNGVKALKSGPEGLNVMKQLTQNLSKACVDVAFDVAGSMAMAQLSNTIAGQVMALFRTQFREQVELAMAGPLAHIRSDLIELMVKNGEQQTEQSFSQAMNRAYQQLAQQQVMNKALDMMQQISSKLAKMGGGQSKVWNAITEVSATVSQMFNDTRYVRLIASMVSNVAELFNTVQQEIAASSARVKNKAAQSSMTREAAAEKVTAMERQLVDRLLQQIEQGVQRIFNQVGQEKIGAMVLQPLQHRCHEEIQDFCQKTFVETARLRDYAGLNLRAGETPYLQPGGSPFKSAEQMDWEEAKAILQQQTAEPMVETPRGPKPLAKVEKALAKKQAQEQKQEEKSETVAGNTEKSQKESPNPHKPRKPKMVLKKQGQKHGKPAAKAHVVKDRMGADPFEKLLAEGMDGMYERMPKELFYETTKPSEPTVSEPEEPVDFESALARGMANMYDRMPSELFPEPGRQEVLYSSASQEASDTVERKHFLGVSLKAEPNKEGEKLRYKLEVPLLQELSERFTYELVEDKKRGISMQIKPYIKLKGDLSRAAAIGKPLGGLEASVAFTAGAAVSVKTPYVSAEIGPEVEYKVLERKPGTRIGWPPKDKRLQICPVRMRAGFEMPRMHPFLPKFAPLKVDVCVGYPINNSSATLEWGAAESIANDKKAKAAEVAL